jgi:ribosomal protein L15
LLSFPRIDSPPEFLSKTNLIHKGYGKRGFFNKLLTVYAGINQGKLDRELFQNGAVDAHQIGFAGYW